MLHADSAKPAAPVPAFRQAITRKQLHTIVPLSPTTVWTLEQRGEFPRRFCLGSRRVVWYLDEVQAWLASRRLATEQNLAAKAPAPDVRRRRVRPVKR